jgi:hypothetical protein
MAKLLIALMRAFHPTGVGLLMKMKKQRIVKDGPDPGSIAHDTSLSWG